MIIGQRDLVKAFAKLLDKFKVNYLLTGSLAVSYYGYPRATHDIDFVLEVSQEDSLKILRLVKSLGKDYLADRDQIKQAIGTSSQFNIYHLPSGIKIDFWIAGESEFEKNKFKRRKKILVDKQEINLVSQEDLILTKLLWCKKIKSERHLRDCAGILKIQEKQLDLGYLNFWAKKLKTEKLIEEVKRLEY